MQLTYDLSLTSLRRSGGAVGPVYLLDTYAGASFAYSARKLRSAQTQTYVVLVLGGGTYGTPNSQYVVAADDAGVTTATAVTYDGVGTPGATTIADLLSGGNDIQIVTKVDATGNGRSITQAVAVNQPFLAQAGVLRILNTGKPTAPYAPGSGRYLDRLNVPVAEMAGSGTDLTNFLVTRPTNYSSQFAYYGWGTGIANVVGMGNFSNAIYFDPPEISSRVTSAFSATTERQWTGWRSGSNAVLRANGSVFASNASASGSNSGTANYRLFGSYGLFANTNPGALDTYIGEQIHYPTKLSDPDISAIEANQKAFWGTP